MYHDFKFYLSSDIGLGLKVYISRARLPGSLWRAWGVGDDDPGVLPASASPPDATYVTVQASGAPPRARHWVL